MLLCNGSEIEVNISRLQKSFYPLLLSKMSQEQQRVGNMGYMGYVKVPRELFASEEWTEKRKFSRIEAQIDLLQSASYTEGRVVHCVTGDVILHRGQLLTSMRALADRWKWSPATVYRYLQTLKNANRNSIRIHTETVSETGKTLITICDLDGWCFGVSRNETVNETVIETGAETVNETHIEIKDSNTRGKISNNTPVNDIMGGVGGLTAKTSVEPEADKARELIEWISVNVPNIARMQEPLTEQNAVWMLRRYDVEDIRRIIATMQSKGAHLRNSNAYTTFVNYAKLDIHLRRKHNISRGYSYEEFCDLTGSQGKFSADDFIRKVVDGRPLWFRKQNIVIPN